MAASSWPAHALAKSPPVTQALLPTLALPTVALPPLPPLPPLSPADEEGTVDEEQGDAPPLDPTVAAVAAAAMGDTHAVEDFLSSGGHPDTSAAGVTLLAAAAGKGAAQLVTKLLEHGASIDLRVDGDAMGGTALEHACAARHPVVVRALLDAGASTKARSPRTGLTAFEALRETSRLEVLGAAEFVRLMDCARAFNKRCEHDEVTRFAQLVPPPTVVVGSREDQQLDAWTQRVAREKTSLDALVHENERRSINHGLLERNLFATIADVHGKNVNDRVQSVSEKLSRARLSRQPTVEEQKAMSQRQGLLGAKYSPKFMLKTLGIKGRFH